MFAASLADCLTAWSMLGFDHPVMRMAGAANACLRSGED
jgi:hypothetical protein